MKTLLTITLLILSTPCFAGLPRNYTLRNANGTYAGRMTINRGSVRYYDKSGFYQGRAQYGRSGLSLYNRSGSFRGSIR